MTWLARIALTVISCALIRSLWSGLGPPWLWPAELLRAGCRGARRVRQWVAPPPPEPDPFTALQVQHRLGLIAGELRVLEAEDADLTYYARAHRIHTRRSAYDQLLAEACALAGVPAQPYRPADVARSHPARGWNADERFSAEMELAARGWHW
jgi:hypothetical protein